MILFIALMVLFVLAAFACIAYNGKDDNKPMPPEAFQGRWKEEKDEYQRW